MNHRLLLRIVLAWALLIQPLGAATHAWSHLDAAAQQHQDDGPPGTHAACELCVAYAHAGAGLPSAGIECPVVTAVVPLPDIASPRQLTPARTAYLARAPPHIL